MGRVLSTILLVFLVWGAAAPAEETSRPLRRLFEGYFTDYVPSLVDGDPNDLKPFGDIKLLATWLKFLEDHPELAARREVGAKRRSEFLQKIDSAASLKLDLLGVDQRTPASVLRSFEAFLRARAATADRPMTQLEIEVAAKSDTYRRYNNSPDWNAWDVKQYYQRKLRKYEEENRKGPAALASQAAFSQWKVAEKDRIATEIKALEKIEAEQKWEEQTNPQVTTESKDAEDQATRERIRILKSHLKSMDGTLDREKTGNLELDLKGMELDLKSSVTEYEKKNNSSQIVSGALPILDGFSDLAWSRDSSHWTNRNRLAQLNPLAVTVEHRLAESHLRPSFWKKVVPFIIVAQSFITGGKFLHDEGHFDPIYSGLAYAYEKTGVTLGEAWRNTSEGAGKFWDGLTGGSKGTAPGEGGPGSKEGKGGRRTGPGGTERGEAKPGGDIPGGTGTGTRREPGPTEFMGYAPPPPAKDKRKTEAAPDSGDPRVAKYDHEWESIPEFRIVNQRAKKEQLPTVIERANQKEMEKTTPFEFPPRENGPLFLLESLTDQVPSNGKVAIPRPRGGNLATLDVFDTEGKRLELGKDFKVTKTEDGIPVIELSKEKAKVEVRMWAGYHEAAFEAPESFLLPERLEHVEGKLREAGFLPIADNLKTLIATAKAEDRFIWTSEVVKVLAGESRYTYNPAKRAREIPDNVFAPLTGFLDENGRFCTQCTGASRLVKLVLDEHDKGEPFAHVNREISILRNPKDGVFTSPGHAQNSRALKGEGILEYFDGTPSESDGSKRAKLEEEKNPEPPSPEKEKAAQEKMEEFARKAMNTMVKDRPTIDWGREWVYYHRFRFRGQVELIDVEGPVGGEPPELPEPPPGKKIVKVGLPNTEAIQELKAARDKVLNDGLYQEMMKKARNSGIPPQDGMRLVGMLLSYAEGDRSLAELGEEIQRIDRDNPNLKLRNEADLPRALSEAHKVITQSIDAHTDRFTRRETRNFPLLANSGTTWPVKKLLASLVRDDWAPLQRYILVPKNCSLVNQAAGESE